MKNKFYLIITLVLCLFLVLYLQFGRIPHVNHINSTNIPDGHTANITITLHTLFVLNTTNSKDKVVRMILDNDFHNIKISDELLKGPTVFQITVYTNDFTRYFNMPSFYFEHEIKTDS